MKKSTYILIAILLCLNLYQFFRKPADTGNSPAVTADPVPAATAPAYTVQPSEIWYTYSDIEKLEDTELFYDGTLEHIFYGEVNKKGNAVGYHYDRVKDTPGRITEGTRTDKDRYGVYTGKVTVDGAAKTGNKGYSSFFPDDMSPQEVVDAVNQAYENMERLSGDLYAGICDAGFEIDIVIDDDGKIVTAYPVKEE